MATVLNPYERIGADWERRVAIDWGVYAAPETFLVNPAGTVVYKQIAAMTPEVWQRQYSCRASALALPAQSRKEWRRRMIMPSRFTITLLALALGQAALAVDNAPPLPNAALQERYLALCHHSQRTRVLFCADSTGEPRALFSWAI